MKSPKILTTENSRTALTPTNKTDFGSLEIRHQYVAAITVTLSALCAGACLGWTSAAVPTLLSGNYVPLRINKTQGAWIGSFLTLGAFIGALPAGSLAAYCGRKRCLQIIALPLFGSWWIIAFSNSVMGIYVARFMGGVTCGIISVIAPMYVGEIAHPSIRGVLGTFFQLQITIGLLIQYVLSASILNFQTICIASSVFPFIFFVLSFLIPESAIYLCSKADVEGARKSLTWFQGREFDVEEELVKINAEILETHLKNGGIKEIINSRASTKALIISLGLMLFQQLSGINAVLFYGASIFQDAGTSLSPFTCIIIIGIVQVAATFASTLLIEKTGRKLLLIMSSIIMSLCLTFLALYMIWKETDNLPAFVHLVPLISLCLYIVMFSIGFGPIPWLMVGELFDSETKEVAGSCAAALNWFLAFLVTNQFQNMITYLGKGGTFGTFAFICGVGTMFLLSLVPETKGKSIEEIKCLLNCKNIDPIESDLKHTSSV